ncbi:hypothetical protein KFL_012840020 [Klebsormidium nitens]|uniref:Uncharacterized protein n=1 Tax=Klebsormidium nitens TaxID=105231 RepID=A0A1Y1IQ72_KLENI|nr:hypothetical protein KFL_012840020 [Klebsormidium nitens]|eukprot:GAQ93075.1 hypothetical protein KFL_012840020 [Klebsormidium nitens]
MASITCRMPTGLSVGGTLGVAHKDVGAGSRQKLSQVSPVSSYSGLRPLWSQKRTARASGYSSSSGASRRSVQVKALLNPQDDPIINEALKEPVAFFGGLFSGLLRLDLKEEPLKDWLEKTADAAGVKPDGSVDSIVIEDEEGPVEIDIEID